MNYQTFSFETIIKIKKKTAINADTVTPGVEMARSKSKIRIKFLKFNYEQRSASVKAHL